MENTGPVPESSYPYKGYDDRCRVDPSKSVFPVKDYYLMGSEDEKEMLNLLYETGPLSVCLNADPLQWYTVSIILFYASRAGSLMKTIGAAIQR